MRLTPYRSASWLLGKVRLASRSRERFVLTSIAGVWTVYLALVALRIALITFPHRKLLLERHLVVAAVGAGLTWFLHLALQRFVSRAITVRIGASLLLAAVPAGILALVNYDVMFVFNPEALWSASFRAEVRLPEIAAQTITENYFLFAAWATLTNAFDSAMREADARGDAREAELRALRYQLEPHFMFNALNTISALVMAERPAEAERTIAALAEFMRETLATDATADVALERELRLQEIYLAIERVRFGDRLRVDVRPLGATRVALVPPLILQPVIENAVRHAVARVARPVTVSLWAFRKGDVLHLHVEDDGPGAAPDVAGTGVGLRNVAGRLAARFGGRAWCVYGARPGGGFQVEIALPFRTAAI
ncbi:sensor histidine kinase [Lichenicoccus roseus]|uniref:histidine kinase n=1 Tax=Lichenicoccus roseus TaxID=2683649 RepID=A0A5R9J232_9PROT|nr:histidine kinase [Lichenicoccus roseus]TLU70537.1 sensor histidine kinase [Lichenicoccus roseus]